MYNSFFNFIGLNTFGFIALWFKLFLMFLIIPSCVTQNKPSQTTQVSLYEQINRTAPLYSPVPKPGPRDWLAIHKEPGQTFAQYKKTTLPDSTQQQKVFYIQPIGKFNPKQQEILNLTAEYLSIYYQLTVKFLPNIPTSAIPQKAQRRNKSTKQNQILTTHVLYNVLKKNFPKDAALVLALTSEDLYPAPRWNFVFGQASLRDKVGVWSMSRFGDPTLQANYNLCLLRTFKTATHETGHMLNIHHCIAYLCNMGGSNHLGELDKKPVWFCPECTTKICWLQKISPTKRAQELAQFWRKLGFKENRNFYKQALRLMNK